MTRIAIIEDNKIIRESLIEFVQADPECRPAWLQFVGRQQSVQPKQIMDYEEKTRVITKLMQSNPEETTRLERHYEEMVAAYARREKTAQEQMEHLIAEIAKLKGQGD